MSDTTSNNNVIWYPKPERLVIDAAQYAVPDRRDERIATLEAALREIRTLAIDPPWRALALDTIHHLAVNALAGEAQPSATVDEELAI